jgi:hypothetical protein
MNQPKIKLFIIAVAISIIILLFIFWVRGPASYPTRVLWTRQSLEHIRASIECFKETEGRYPTSSAELHDRGGEKGKIQVLPEHRKEYISQQTGVEQEHSQLDGGGGWYYNSNMGEIRVNLTKPLKNYFKIYLRGDRNEIPSEW